MGGAARCDVVIVGGRVAGALTAARMAARGLRVIVLESQAFPSDTMSTHFFRGDGLVRSLREVGVLDEVLATGAPPLRAEIFYVNGRSGREEPPQEPGEVGYCLSVRRITLDAILAAHVSIIPGVVFRTRTRVADVIWEGPRVSGVVTDDGAAYLADVVVGADGRRSRMAQRVHAATQEHHAPARVMYFQYVSGWTSPAGDPPSVPEFSLLGDELAYVFPSDQGIACVAISLPVAAWTTRRERREAQFAERLRRHAGLRDRLECSQPVGALVSAPPTPSVVRCAAGPGWALVGDAGTHQDPWSGLGMDTAARQAEALAGSFDDASWHLTYQQARDAVTLEGFTETLRLGRDLRALDSS